MSVNPEPYKLNSIVQHSQRLLNSFAHWTGRELLPRMGTPAEQAASLYRTAFIVVSHGTEADPILNYGNSVALDLWEMDWAAFTRTPSRLTAETAQLQEECARFMEEALQKGYILNYRGIRISRTGKRFWIENATIWNVLDEQGTCWGQAATFSEWRPAE